VSILSGVRVVEFADGWTGAALAGRLLAELGAVVIKIEPLEGDSLRRRAPFINGESAAFNLVASGKRSVALDYMRSTEAARTLQDVISASDVVLDGLPTGTLAAIRLSGEASRQVTPGLIWCDVSSFGRRTPLDPVSASDLAAQAMSGFMATTGYAQDPPTRAGFPLSEHAAAAFAIATILAALFHRARTGDGQDIDIAAVDCLAYFLSSFLPPVFVCGEVPKRQGFRHPLIAPWDAYEAADGKVVICSGNNAHWHAILRLVGRSDLVDDGRYATSEGRVAHVEDVNAVIQSWIGHLSADRAIEQLHGIGIPAGPILGLQQVFAHPHFEARRMLVSVKEGERHAATLGSVFKMSVTPGAIDRLAPLLGADNAEYRMETRTPAKGALA
jgi:CoA:oxalate CoA-transferase